MLGILIADRATGGAHVNPAVTAALCALGEVSLPEALAFVAAQLLGAALGFPLLDTILARHNATAPGSTHDAVALGAGAGAAHEFGATFLLLAGVCAISGSHLGARAGYFAKQSLVALALRLALPACIATPTGPTMNPALGTVQAFYSVGVLPRGAAHYAVYWAGPVLGGVAATVLWASLHAGRLCTLLARAPPPPAKKTD